MGLRKLYYLNKSALSWKEIWLQTKHCVNLLKSEQIALIFFSRSPILDLVQMCVRVPVAWLILHISQLRLSVRAGINTAANMEIETVFAYRETFLLLNYQFRCQNKNKNTKSTNNKVLSGFKELMRLWKLIFNSELSGTKC